MEVGCVALLDVQQPAGLARRYNRNGDAGACAPGCWVLEERVDELKAIIARNDGRNAVDARFVRTVDDLVALVYDRIGEVACIPSRALFDLFVIKVLYVQRRSRHADVVEYLGEMLDRYVYARELFAADDEGRPRRVYFSDMLDEDRRPRDVPNVSEAYRRYADSALFLSGVFPESLRRRRATARGPLRRRTPPAVDASYYVTTGKTMYRMSARHDHAACEHRSTTLEKLAEHFEVYVEALNEMSQRYIIGQDMDVIGDHMLDAYNRFRGSGAREHLEDARRYASLLRIDERRFLEPGA